MSNYSVIDELLKNAKEKLIPLQASLELTTKCNHSCTHCYADKEFRKDLSFSDWKMILDKLREAGTLYIVFMGGEALLHIEFIKILNYAHQKSFHSSLITNGFLIDSADYVNELKEAGLNNATISLYSMNSEVHEKMTGTPGSFNKAIKAIELLLDAKINVGVNSLLTKLNIEDYFDIADFAMENNLEFNSDPVVTCDLMGKGINLSLRPTRIQLEKHFSDRAKMWPDNIPKSFEVNPCDNVCNIARSKCAINHKGELLPCVEVREVIGNLLENDFKDVWFNEIAEKWRSLKIREIKNPFNDSTDGLIDNCPGMGLNELGDPLVIPEYMKDLAKIQKLTQDYYLKIKKVPFQGMSMWPLLREGDKILIDFNSKKYSPGDIVLFKYFKEFTAHRVILYEGELSFKGDRSIHIDDVKIDHSFGKVIGYERFEEKLIWGESGQFLKGPIAKCSCYTTTKYPGPIRKVFFTVIICLNLFSKYFSKTQKPL